MCRKEGVGEREGMDFIVEERATRIKSTLSPFLEHARVGCEHHYGKSAPAHDRIGSFQGRIADTCGFRRL